MIARRLNTLAMLATPALSFGTLAVALGVGASSETLAAIVYGAPPGAHHTGLAWQVDVMFEDRGVREIKPHLPIAVHAEWKGNSRDWKGTTTHDGAAEVWLDFSSITVGDSIDLTITTDDAEKKILARGFAVVPAPSGNVRGNVTRTTLTPIRRERDDLDVAILGGALASEFSSEVWVRARDHQLHPRLDDHHDPNAVSGAHVQILPVDGLSIATNDAVTDDEGWAKLDVTAKTLAVEATIQLNFKGIVSSWTGAFPIVLGATRASITQDDAGNLHASVTRPLVTKSDAYVEIDDDVGRIFGDAVPLAADQNDFASAQINLPKLDPGNYWIVSGSGPRAAETMSAGTFAIPFRVGEKGLEPSTGELAQRHAGGFPRAVVLDGFLEARRVAAQRRHRGISIAFAALAIGAVVEALSILRAARAGSNVKATWITGKTGQMAIGVGVSLLGFALLAAFVATH